MKAGYFLKRKQMLRFERTEKCMRLTTNEVHEYQHDLSEHAWVLLTMLREIPPDAMLCSENVHFIHVKSDGDKRHDVITLLLELAEHELIDTYPCNQSCMKHDDE